MLGNTKNLMTLHVLDTAQWKSCAAKFFSIPAIILLFGKSQKCLYLSQISMDLNSVKKRHFASVLPQLLSTHLTSSFNIRLVQIWPRTFPLCSGNKQTMRLYIFSVMTVTSEPAFLIYMPAPHPQLYSSVIKL